MLSFVKLVFCLVSIYVKALVYLSLVCLQTWVHGYGYAQIKFFSHCMRIMLNGQTPFITLLIQLI